MPIVGDNPIRVGVGEMASLPEHAIANITLPDHIFHNDEMGKWGTCPQTVPNQGSGAPPEACNQVYREPYIEGGRVKMRTRGTGENDFDFVSEKILGPFSFDGLDEGMIDAMRARDGYRCPSAPSG